MTKMRTMAATVAIAAVAWPQVADAACSVRSILGRWSIQIVATETVSETRPQVGGGEYWEETRHILCPVVTIERAANGRARGVVAEHGTGCNNGNSLTEPPDERNAFLLVRHGRSCSWLMVSEAVQSDPEVVRTGALGTRGGINTVTFTPDRGAWVGSGSFVIGIGNTGDGPVGAGWPLERGFDDGEGGGQDFRVTMFAVKQ